MPFHNTEVYPKNQKKKKSSYKVLGKWVKSCCTSAKKVAQKNSKKREKLFSWVTHTEGEKKFQRGLVQLTRKAKAGDLCPGGAAEWGVGGKFQRASAPLDSFCGATIPDVALTPQSDRVSAWEHRPAGPARHQNPSPSFFPSLFPPLLLLLLLPLLAVAAYHLDCAKSPQDCMKDPLVLLCKPQRLEKCTASPPTHPAALRTWKSSRCFTPTYEINDDIDMQIPARARCVMILSFFDSCVIAAFYYWRGLRALKALIPQAEALTVNIQFCLCFVFFFLSRTHTGATQGWPGPPWCHPHPPFIHV